MRGKPYEIICGVYKITNPIGEIYVGQSKNCHKREIAHKSNKNNNHPKLFNSIQKYGWGTHKFEIIHRCNNDELDTWEIYYINYHDTLNHGLNSRGGGNRGFKMPEESVKRMKEKLSGPNSPFYGKSPSPETREKMRKAKIGYDPFPNLRKALDAIRGVPLSEERKQKLREAKLGIPRPQSVKDAISLKNRKYNPIIAIKDCAIMEFPTVIDTAIGLKRDRKSVYSAIKKNNFCNGYKLYFLNENS